MIRTGIYIDGHNFFYGALKGTSLKWVDLEKLSRALRTTPLVTVHEGRFLTSVKSKALVISNDSDLTEAIRLSVLFGAKIGILNPHASRTSRYLRLAASFEVPFRREVIERCQFQIVVRDSAGREIHKPRAWR